MQYAVVKKQDFKNIQNMTDIKEALLLWFIRFLINKTVAIGVATLANKSAVKMKIFLIEN